MRTLIASIVLGAALSGVAAQDVKNQKPAAAASEKDVGSIDGILKALYDTISGPAGAARNWDRLRALFHPTARLMPVRHPREGQGGQVGLRALTVEDYIRNAGPFLEREGFFEKEVARKVEEFSHIAHVFSTYESRRKEGDLEPFVRGINSIQLFNDGTRWWVVGVMWDQATPDVPIPPRYLPGATGVDEKGKEKEMR